ncbi:MAG: hypothetical protein QOJ93_2299, partial [Actinomycetota bacterium]|nr:hypothetical protein [Actinomycetota bacterium]
MSIQDWGIFVCLYIIIMFFHTKK